MIRVPTLSKAPAWGAFASYAAENSLATNFVYLARVNKDQVAKENEGQLAMMGRGELDDETLYIIDDWKNLRANLSYKKNSDLLARIDGFNVLAPRWKECLKCLDISKGKELPEWIPVNYALERLYFNTHSIARNLTMTSGWPPSGEEWGTWASGTKSQLVIPMPKPTSKDLVLSLNLRALVGPAHPQQQIRIWLDKIDMGVYDLKRFEDNNLSIKVPKDLQKQKFLVIDFDSLNPISPKDLGISPDDTRLLSFGMRSLKLDIQ